MDSAALKKFLFQRDFEKENGVEVFFTHDQMKKSEKEAFQRGVQEGRDEAHRMLETQIKELMLQLQEQMSQVITKESAFRKEVADGSYQIILTMIQKLILPSIQNHALEAFESLAKEVFDKIAQLPTLKIFVHPEILKPLEERFKEKDWATDLIFKPDETLSSLDIRLDWGDGGLNYCIQDILKEMQELLEPQLPHALETIGELHE